VFHVRALCHTKTLITNKCTKRVYHQLLHTPTCFDPAGSSSGRTFRYRFTRVALYSWVRMCCWLCTALFLEAWSLRGPGLRHILPDRGRLFLCICWWLVCFCIIMYFIPICSDYACIQCHTWFSILSLCLIDPVNKGTYSRKYTDEQMLLNRHLERHSTGGHILESGFL
jgi:hypothetical protein